jgi:hypothetical protein
LAIYNQSIITTVLKEAEAWQKRIF